ncbi:hypothetical protein K438DRAFT_1771073 [Mycena galopus ATCC 62051]|nr:hypothetical protein K438DRAFT_1771073 [Mycena galopus ATCC 62051]
MCPCVPFPGHSEVDGIERRRVRLQGGAGCKANWVRHETEAGVRKAGLTPIECRSHGTTFQNRTSPPLGGAPSFASALNASDPTFVEKLVEKWVGSAVKDGMEDSPWQPFELLVRLSSIDNRQGFTRTLRVPFFQADTRAVPLLDEQLLISRDCGATAGREANEETRVVWNLVRRERARDERR